MKQNMIYFLVLTLLSAQNISAQNICKMCEQLKNNVVKITATFSNGKDENGFGTVVSERNNRLYIVTAKHVIYDIDQKGNPSVDNKTKSVEITFFSEQGKSYSAVLLNLSYTPLDIALLEVEKPKNYSWSKNYYSTVMERGTEVWYIGRAGKWYIPTVPGSINEISLEDEISIDNVKVAPGTSGAPLINSEGLVGIIFEDDERAKAYPINKVIKLITKLWNYKWQIKLKDWPGAHEIHVGMGALTIESIATGLGSAIAGAITGTGADVHGTGAICFGYRYHFNKRIGIGITGVIEHINVTYKDSPKKYEWNGFYLMADSRYYYFHRKYFQLYSGLNAGLAILTDKGTSSPETTTGFALQINALGFRVGKKIGVFAELGFGYRGVFNGGISARF